MKDLIASLINGMFAFGGAFAAHFLLPVRQIPQVREERHDEECEGERDNPPAQTQTRSLHGFQGNLRLIRDVLLDRFPGRSFAFIEKLTYTVLLLGRFCDISNFGALILRGERWERHWSTFVDVYISAWLVFLSYLLFEWPFVREAAVFLATYRLVMILSNQLASLFVDTQTEGWAQDSIRRTLILSFINLLSLITSYAILYKATGVVWYAIGERVVVEDPLQLLYFSFGTMTTAGAGDMFANCSTGYWLVIGEFVTGLSFVASVLPAFLGALSPTLERERHPTA